MQGIKGFNTFSLFVFFLFLVSPLLYSCGGTEFTGPFATGVDVSPDSQIISVGANQQFVATVNFDDGGSQDLTTKVKWTSSNPSVATINESGLATGISAGSVTIHADYGNVSGYTALYVKD